MNRSKKELSPLEVYPRKNESPERMIKRFVKIVKADGVLKEVMQKRGYQKPSQLRREKRRLADQRRRQAS